MEKLNVLLSHDSIFLEELYSSDAAIDEAERLPMPKQMETLIYFLHNVSKQLIEL